MSAEQLAAQLYGAWSFEQAGNYDDRNQAIYGAVVAARNIGIRAGVRIDPTQSEWPVVFIDLPTGQVSWHVEQFPYVWDGHDTDEKWRRVHAYVNDVAPWTEEE